MPPLIEEVEGDGGYTFHALDVAFPPLADKDMQTLLHKWGMKDLLRVHKFRYDQAWDDKLDKDGSFLTQFLASQAFQNTASVYVGKQWQPLGAVTKATCDKVPCTVTSMAPFDCLVEGGDICSEEGRIKPAFGDDVQGVRIEDDLRKAMLDEDSDGYESISESLRGEFIYSLFQHFVIGGSLCQYEDNVNTYIDTVKVFYKDLLAVRRNKNTSNIEVASLVYRVRSLEGGAKLGHSRSPFNMQHISIDPFKRTIVWYYFQRPESGWS